MSMRVEGLAELKRALHDLPLKVAQKHLLEATRAGAEIIRERAGELAPREPGAPDLAENIGISRVRSDDDHAVTLAIGPTRGFFYGFFQEFGTRHHSAQPFMRPAFDTMQAAAMEAVRRVLWLALGTSSRSSGGGREL